MKIFTIGFTKKNAEQFFTCLKKTELVRVVDVRLNNVSQLAGFTKKEDLRFFLRRICNIDYIHLPELAPTQEILDAYKKNGGDWQTYEQQFVELMTKRCVEKILVKEQISGSCLLCSEATPEHCHRRLIAEYLQKSWGNIEIIHL
ncbi:MAG: hypothetical protein UT30_C0026G0005 [Candidatus Uhrbacteria bacterium GW2011_GWF2_39_13]|uniref:DUF488 domain-containing protein n=1 Tax=Candidatus Uhrbacteria bacterium GW2011_GWF2_39_13 TaxID=1618995 RepID=A0A0G0PZG5_9BACT|nr:MAG: hypothetical protein UT30_C0026G0005 [Candidatus Uhrbacteria bacterium GW2011_GWF2_39_13]